MTSPPAVERNLMYLAFDQWSPRFDSTFFSFKMTAKTLHSTPPSQESVGTKRIEGKTNHPAWYYTIQVHSEHRSHTIVRRYSQFHWLYDELRSHPPANRMDYGSDQPPICIPPKTCPFQIQTDEFAQTRLEELSEFLKDALLRPGYASHPAVARFLELDRFEVPAEEIMSTPVDSSNGNTQVESLE